MRRKLFIPPPQRRSHTSAVLLEMISGELPAEISLGQLTARLGDRTFGMLLILAASLNVIPLANLILGPVIEERFIQIVTGSDGSLTGFVSPERPLGLALAGVFALVWVSAIAVGVRRRVARTG